VSAARGLGGALICGLPTDSTGVITLYVLIGVNTKMGATPAHFTSQLETASRSNSVQYVSVYTSV